jgi:hypothetical protein
MDDHEFGVARVAESFGESSVLRLNTRDDHEYGQEGSDNSDQPELGNVFNHRSLILHCLRLMS